MGGGAQSQSKWLEKLCAHLSDCQLVTTKSLGAIYLALFARRSTVYEVGAVSCAMRAGSGGAAR